MFGKIKLLGFMTAVGVMLASLANAQERPCKSNDDCDQLRFEAAEKELAELMPRAFAFIDRFAAEETRETAKSELSEAQRHWVLFRNAACKAEAAMFFLRSARTTRGYTASCLHEMTIERLGDLKRRFLLKDNQDIPSDRK